MDDQIKRQQDRIRKAFEELDRLITAAQLIAEAEYLEKKRKEDED